MEKIDFGLGMSMPVRPDKRKRTEEFLAKILGCRETMRNETYTCFRFPNGQILGITPEQRLPLKKNMNGLPGLRWFPMILRRLKNGFRNMASGKSLAG